MILDWAAEELVLTEPLRTSQATMAGRAAVCVRLSHQGVDGFGEVVTSVRQGLDVAGIDRRLRELVPWVRRFDDPAELLATLPQLRARLADALAVAAAVDAAVHDLIATRDGVAVYELLAAPQWPAIPTAYTIGIVEPLAAARVAADLVAAGFSVIKVKLGAADSAEDIARVSAVRAAAPDVRLLVDPNGAWSAGLAVEVLGALARCDIDAVEQPVAAGNPQDLVHVSQRTGLPVIADEDAATLADVCALPAGVAGINIKLAECGGLAAALELVAAAGAAGMDVMLGCLVASSLGIAPAAHLSGLARWVDLDGHLLLAEDPWEGLGGRDGVLRCPDRCGLGVVRRQRGGNQGSSIE
ncbi:MAG: enolase C-terminal domain-like protein [Pseudonocardiaceae bacterium]